MLLFIMAFAAATAVTMKYPASKVTAVSDDYFGTQVKDPYRWLEDDGSAETKAWVKEQNALTFAWLKQVPERSRIKERLTKLWSYERYPMVPIKRGKYTFFSKNDGLQNQAVFYVQEAGKAPRVLLDPNALSVDGTIAVSDLELTDDGKLAAYALNAAGSDWRQWKVRDVASLTDKDDRIEWTKFSEVAWLKDGSGFFYGRFPEPKAGDELKGLSKNQKIYFHALGSKQADDVLVYERTDEPDWMYGLQITDDGRYLLLSQYESSERKNRLFVRDLKAKEKAFKAVFDAYDAAYRVVGNDGDTLYVHTDNAAPRFRLVAVNLKQNDPAKWRELIAEAKGSRDVLAHVSMISNRFAAVWRTDAHEKVRVYSLKGALENDIAFPSLGTVGAIVGERKDNEASYAFSRFTSPTTVYRYDAKAKTSTVWKQPSVDFDPSAYETKQVFYPSKDGTQIPMFIVHKRGLSLDGANPTLLYGYGGFDISLTPVFSPANLAWMEMGGVYASANLRGGGEYGAAWHDAGRLSNKQNVFDDFIAAAEWLIANKYTSTSKLAIMGGSNGGLLVGAVMTQRPALFGAAIAAVGVMDMLRFHKFTIGWAWKSDYGSSETKEGFETLIKYSPLQAIKKGVKYPATLVITGDHDDRVVPAHSHKFTATLQAAQGGDAPVLTRIETNAGHGAGKPTTKLIEERADVFSFLVRVLGMKLPSA